MPICVLAVCLVCICVNVCVYTHKLLCIRLCSNCLTHVLVLPSLLQAQTTGHLRRDASSTRASLPTRRTSSWCRKWYQITFQYLRVKPFITKEKKNMFLSHRQPASEKAQTLSRNVTLLLQNISYYYYLLMNST